VTVHQCTNPRVWCSL